jgi:hypothetical protein
MAPTARRRLRSTPDGRKLTTDVPHFGKYRFRQASTFSQGADVMKPILLRIVAVLVAGFGCIAGPSFANSAYLAARPEAFVGQVVSENVG